MKLKELHLYDFGPFQDYSLEFPADEKSCVLITGKNNAGKTTIIRALHLLSNALKFADYSSHPIVTELLKKDTEVIDIGSMIHRFQDGEAIIEAVLDNGKIITVNLDSISNSVTCTLPSHMHRSSRQLLGFIPPLGQLAQRETLLSHKNILRYINTTLAPLHFRNHLYYFISDDQYPLIQRILEETWEGIRLQKYQLDSSTGFLTCLYEEDDFYNEIAWAGQGLQIWLQILTNLVRLREYPVLVFDEPEIFLHPEKQNDLIQLLHDYYPGTAIVATHSTELVSNVDITHIIHVQKDTPKAALRKSSDLNALEGIRKSLGSCLNIHASQFEDVDCILFTEYKIDYDVIKIFISHFGINKKIQNIRLSGYSQWKHCTDYREAYRKFFGKDIECSVLLDRDYYPSDFRENIIDELQAKHVKTTFTPGKEIENLFLEGEFLAELLPEGADRQELDSCLDTIYEQAREICFIKYVEFAKRHSNEYRSKEFSTVYSEMQPDFESTWNDKRQRHNLIKGKDALAEVRDFFRSQYRNDLTASFLATELAKRRGSFVRRFLSTIL